MRNADNMMGGIIVAAMYIATSRDLNYQHNSRRFTFIFFQTIYVQASSSNR